MPFEKKFEKIAKKVKKVNEWRLLLNSTIFSIAILVAGFFYLFLGGRAGYNLITINKALAEASVIIIGISFALSGIAYFWDFLDRKIIYRKHLGLVGFAFAAIHIIVSLFFIPGRFAYPEWFTGHLASVVFGIIAMVIFTIMAAISNRYAILELGSKRWRLILRTGYIAYIFVIIHIALLKSVYWIRWFNADELSWPSLSLVSTVFAILVILLRIALSISLFFKKRAKK